MKKLFSGYYRPTTAEFKKLWSTCIFVLDANVLLNLYRYPEPARKDLFKVLNKVRERIWLPYHAALEFERNRLAVIAEQHRRFSEVKKVLEDARSRLETGLNNLQLDRRHSSIDPSSFLGSVQKLFGDFNEHLGKSEEGHTDVCDEDKLRDEISSLLDEKVGPPPNDQKELDDIYTEGESRYKNSVPPGFMDWEKGKGSDSAQFSYGGLLFKRVYGDLILWKQIIRHVKDAKIPSVIFITDDNKEDWWMVVESQGPKTIGPRPELIDEIRREARAELFYMYNSEQFMKMAEQHLNVQVREESINQVRDLIVERRYVGASLNEPSILRAVVSWVEMQYPNSKRLAYSAAGADIEVVLDPQTRIGFEVKDMSQITIEAIADLSNSRGSAKHLIFSELNLAIVTTLVYLQSGAGRARIGDIQRLFFNEGKSSAYDSIYIGYVDYSGNGSIFSPVWRCGSHGAGFFSGSIHH